MVPQGLRENTGFGGVGDLFGAVILEQPAHAFQQHAGFVANGHDWVPLQRRPRPRAMMPRRISRVPPWMEKRGAFIVERAIIEEYKSMASSSGSVGNNCRATAGRSCS